MNRPHFEEDDRNGETEREVAPDAGTLALLARAEVDGQIATARAFPRSFGAFAREARELVSSSQDVAESCIYSLPRGKGAKATTITGPSARFAEIIQYAFGNSRGGGRVVDVVGNFVVAQGVFHDLEKNVMTTMEVRRRITDSYGKKFGDDMIGVTGNAAASIAHRNAVLKAVPKALWLPIYEVGRMVAIGDLSTLEQRRKLCLQWFMHKGVTEEMILAKLELAGVEDIGLDELEHLTGIKTAMREGSLSAERAFGPEPTNNPAATGATPQSAAELATRIVGGRAGTATSAPAPTPAAAPAVAEFQHPLADEMRQCKKKDDLEAVYDEVLAKIPPGDERKALAAVYETEAARIEASFGQL